MVATDGMMRFEPDQAGDLVVVVRKVDGLAAVWSGSSFSRSSKAVGEIDRPYMRIPRLRSL